MFLLYDITSTNFEGNAQVQRGYSQKDRADV